MIALIRAGKIDEADQAGRDLLVRFPEVHDGYDRLGMVYEARGDHLQAAHCYHQVIDFVRAHPDQYETSKPPSTGLSRSSTQRLLPADGPVFLHARCTSVKELARRPSSLVTA